MKTPEEIETLKESLRLPTAFAYQTATQRIALEYIEQLEREKKDLLEERELNDFLRDKVKRLEAQVPKWISVEDRLPEEETSVLICGCGYVDIGWIIDGGWRSEYINDYSADEITHWMPLPEPPKEE